MENIRNLRWYWWSIVVVTGLGYVACFPVLPYNCGFGAARATQGQFCSERERWLFEMSTKVNCGLDVGTDVLSESIPYPA
jgi:hypothetical protein